MYLRQMFLLTAALAAMPAAAQSSDAAPKPPLAPEAQTALIEAARTGTLEYSARLPNFLCTEVMRRYSAPLQAGRDPSWKLLDTLTVHVSYFGQKEDYRVVQVIGKSSDKPLGEFGGQKTMGDFGSMLTSVFRPASEAKFEWSGWSVYEGHTAAVFSYRIELAHSTFHSTQSYITLGLCRKHFSANWAAKGLVYVDPETPQVYRLTIDSVDVPADFPVQNVHIAIDYAIRKVGDRDYLLPVRSISSVEVDKRVYKADTEFADYRKFSADAAVTFGAEADEAPGRMQ